MALKNFKPTTPSQRQLVLVDRNKRQVHRNIFDKIDAGIFTLLLNQKQCVVQDFTDIIRLSYRRWQRSKVKQLINQPLESINFTKRPLNKRLIIATIQKTVVQIIQ